MSTGSVVNATGGYPLAATNSMDARTAAAEALMAYLGQAVFVVGAQNGGSPDIPFRLKQVYPYFPNAENALEFPSASVVEQVITHEAGDLVARPIEETADKFGKGTVLWRTADAVIDFQVDFWTNEDAHRQAIIAQLPWMFAPGEGSAEVLLECPKEYFGATARFALDNIARPDEGDAVYQLNRRARVTVRCEIEVLHLRGVAQLNPVVRLLPSDDPNS